MKDLPLVSIAITTFNQKKYLEECIESCLSQIEDYRNIEIVISDDSSKDGTVEMLEDYREKYPDIIRIFLSKTNQGITINSNRSLMNCRGKYIAIIAGDDLMKKGKIAEQVKILESDSTCGICYHDSEIFNSETGEVIAYSSNLSPTISGDVKKLIKEGCFIGMCCEAMVRAELAQKVKYDTRVPIASDWLFAVEILALGYNVKYINKCLARHRRHGNNITNNSKDNFNISLLQDHVTSCGIILTKYPIYYGEILYREAFLYR